MESVWPIVKGPEFYFWRGYWTSGFYLGKSANISGSQSFSSRKFIRTVQEHIYTHDRSPENQLVSFLLWESPHYISFQEAKGGSGWTITALWRITLCGNFWQVRFSLTKPKTRHLIFGYQTILALGLPLISLTCQAKLILPAISLGSLVYLLTCILITSLYP